MIGHITKEQEEETGRRQMESIIAANKAIAPVSVNSSEWVAELEAAYEHIDSATKILTSRDRFETAVECRRTQNQLLTIVDTERSRSSIDGDQVPRVR